MLSERAQRQVDRFLDAAEDAMSRFDWSGVRQNAQAVLALDPENADAQTFLAAASRSLDGPSAPPGAAPATPGATAVSVDAAPVPTSFCEGRYEVTRFLGEGGKKRVYRAHDTKLDRDVAFALIKTDGLDDEGLLRIKREAQAMGRLGDHPHIVSVHDIGDEAGQPYLVSQLMGGGDVEGLIEKAEGHRLPLETALAIADQVCRALEHAHGHGIVHRDLKPGNVWLTADGTAKLGDFGLAVALDRSRLTQAGMMVGTVSYMPPEQAMGGEVTARSDLYSLGAMLYELVTGRPPFVGDESVAIITQHLNTPPVAPSWHAPDVPTGLEALILRLLEKDPGKRPGSAAEVRQMLAGALTPQPPLPTLGEGEARALVGPSPKIGGGVGERASPVYRQIFVGREAELRQLQAIFDAALSGRGALVAVVGEPGIGKTALCEQLATYVAVRGGKTLVGHCYEEGSLSLPYLPFIEGLRAYVLARPPEALKEELGSGAQEVARIVSEIRLRLSLEPLTPQASRLTPSSDPEEERWRLLQAVSDFLKNASRVQPLLVVLEDLHWADRGTLDLLTHLARNLQECRLVVLVTYRDVEVDRTHPLSSALAELRRLSAFERVALRGLSAPEVQRMLETITGQEVRWGLAEAVHRQTEGNPLFVQEVVRYLVEEGLIRREEGRWQRTGTAPLEMAIPEGLRDVIGKRLSRLSPECNRILGLAAVTGRDFQLQTLEAISGVEEDALVEALDEAVRVGVLEERARVGGVQYRFAHAFFRQTLYEEISVPRRLRMHQQVARALEQQYGARRADHAAELAEHFAHSSDAADLAKAVEYGDLAARRATDVNAYGEAVRLLEQAIDVQEVLDPDDQGTRCDLLVALGQALGPAGEPLRGFQVVAPEALALAEALADQDRSSRVCEMALECIKRYGGPAMSSSPAMQEWAAQADRYARPGTRARVTADFALSRVHGGAGHWSEEAKFAERALEVARRLDSPDLLFRAVSGGMLVGGRAGEGQNLRLAEEFTVRPRDGVSAPVLADVLFQCQSAYLAAGDRARAEDAWRDLAQLASRTADATLLLVPLHLDGLRATLDGELELAVATRERIVARAEELGVGLAGENLSVFVSFSSLLHLGRAEEALAVLRPRAPRARADGVVWPGRLGQTILCLARMGHDDARSQLTRSMQERRIGAPDDDTPLVVLTPLLEAAILLRAHDAVEVLAVRLAREVAVTGRWEVLNVARHLGAAAALLGDRALARAHCDRSLAWATAIRHRPEIALTRLELAELLLADQAPTPTPPPTLGQGQTGDGGSPLPALGEGPGVRAEALAHLDFAIEEFRAMKMQPSLERALRHKGLLRA